MGRRYQVYIMATHRLQFDHNRRQFAVGNRPAILVFTVADGVVLTEAAKEVAAAEKDCSRTTAADQNALFTEMRAVARHLGQGSRAAVTSFTCQSIHTALPGAEGAGAEEPLAVGKTSCQKTGLHCL